MVASTRDRECVTGADPDAPAPIPTERQFLIESGAASDEFLPGIELRSVAQALIESHASLRHIGDSRVTYLWKRRGGSNGGAAVLGKTIRATGLVRFATGADFVIWIAADNCEGFSNYALEALIYHELCHIDLPDENGNQKTRGHDFEAFADEVRQYGAWKLGLQLAADSFGQLALFD